MSMKSGMTGFVMISRKSNCTALAASCRALTGSRWDQFTHFQMFSGMGPAPCVGSLALGVAPSMLPESSSLLRRSLSSGLSFFLRCRRRAGASFATARIAVEGVAESGASAPRGSAVGSSAAVAASAFTAAGSTSGTALMPGMASMKKAQRRMTGRTRKCTSVGIGPMTTVVTRATVPLIIPIRHKYKKNCLRILTRKASQSATCSVWKMPCLKLRSVHAVSQRNVA
mmetsp:Transcript_41358/g.95819  ORF Transcript_41358/g.95819 Transcript_41358/m.95819 type:complete len:227 (+) Transcript_41358:1055-1735(+)